MMCLGPRLRARLTPPRRAALALVLAAAVTLGGGAFGTRQQPTLEATGWHQWGGPHRNFVSDATGLADSWPEGGPPEVWRRPLGEGHSTIVADGERLYTMYRPRPEGTQRGRWIEEEVVIALDAATGEAMWEYRYPSTPLDFQFGAGPHSTPLVAGDRLFTAGTNKQIHAFARATGALLWSHDLVAEFDAPPTLIRPAVKAGYACSPIAYGDLVIVPAGGEGQSVIAFRQEDGSVAWRGGDFPIAPSSPILIDLAGRAQLVVLGGRTVNGLDPDSGEILWSHPHDTRGDMNNTTPVWGDDGLLFVSSAYDGGSRVLRLSREGEGAAARTRVEELWFGRDLRVLFGSTIRLGNHIYGSSGDFGPAFLTAVDLETGEVAWRERGFSRASLLYADGKAIILDEDGNLTLARLSPGGLTVLSRAQVLGAVSWSAPTLVGTRLYVRDRRAIAAFELAARD